MTSQLLILSFAAKNLRLHWLRSLLAVIGIVIGVLAIGYMGVVENIELMKISDQWKAYDSFIISPNYEYSMKQGKDNIITEKQVMAIRRAIPDYLVIPTYTTSTFQPKMKKEFLGAMVMGIAPLDLAQVTELESGALPRSGTEVAVGGLTALEKNIKPGSMITFVKKNTGGEDEEFPVRVVGVLQMTNRWDIFVDNSIIPYEPWLRENCDFKGYDQVLVKMSNVSEMNATMKAVSDELNRRASEITLNNFNEFRDRFLFEMEQKAATTTAIAGISLVVAGVSIFNVMVMSVMERYREIGVLRSIGTRRGSILSMFIYESLLLGFIGSGIGGVCSLVLGYLYADMIGAMNYFTAPATLMQIPYAMSFGIAISLVSGLYPALKASRLNPIEALRYE